MSEKTFTVTEGRLRAMAKECPEVEKALKKGFPEAFPSKDITQALILRHSTEFDTKKICGTETYVVTCVFGRPIAKIKFIPLVAGYEIYPRTDINIRDFIQVRSK